MKKYRRVSKLGAIAGESEGEWMWMESARGRPNNQMKKSSGNAKFINWKMKNYTIIPLKLPK